MTRNLVADSNDNLRHALGILADGVPGGKFREFGSLTYHQFGPAE
jgi:hypothetical protein